MNKQDQSKITALRHVAEDMFLACSMSGEMVVYKFGPDLNAAPTLPPDQGAMVMNQPQAQQQIPQQQAPQVNPFTGAVISGGGDAQQQGGMMQQPQQGGMMMQQNAGGMFQQNPGMAGAMQGPGMGMGGDIGMGGL